MTKNKIGLLLGVASLSVTLAACGSSSSSSNTTSSSPSTPATTAATTSAATTAPTAATPSATGTITAAGSTFAAPVYTEWGSLLKGITLNYQAVGSGAGITAMEGKTVEFGASDPPLKAADVATFAKVGPVQQLPMFFGAITLSYNLPGVAAGLKLDGTTIANIFLGKITKWNDSAIAALNPGVNLPSTPITVIHRSDSSGTTQGFTNFLSAYSPTWAGQVGSGKDVNWPTGTGAKGNPGVAGAIQATTGSIGYVEQAYALQHKFTYASVKNAAGDYVAPTLASTSAAAPSSIPANLSFSTDPMDSNPAAYPIVSQTFLIVWKDMCKAGIPQTTAKAIGAFLSYGLGAGQSILSEADYAALPASIDAKDKAALATLTCNGAPLT
ncbi:MAG TPA: phosphate ABC transporter substrate-binding protein PstS [Solirubrobacteraceae bacterium]|nr:phosphate ABC transporter substrate-binding protein PstS [Solirubrobacteraceae bacterium]